MILSTDGFVCITINEEPPGQVLTAQGKTPGITMYSTKQATIYIRNTRTIAIFNTMKIQIHQLLYTVCNTRKTTNTEKNTFGIAEVPEPNV